MSYQIAINDDQRLALIAALRAANVGSNDVDHPLQYWLSMLDELPKIESETPRCLHGFCL